MSKKNHDRSPDKRGFSVALPIKLLEELERIAKEESRSRNGQIEYFLTKAVEAWKEKNNTKLRNLDIAPDKRSELRKKG